MLCPHCGTPLQEQTILCSQCGQPIPADAHARHAAILEAYQRGALSPTAYDQAVRELMVQDETGRSWLPAPEPDRYLYWTGQEWALHTTPAISSTTPASTSRRRWLPWVVMASLCLIGVVMALLIARDRQKAQRTEAILTTPKGQLALSLGPRVPLIATTLTVSESDALLTVDRPGDPLDGLALRVPQGAYSEPIEIDISYRPIEQPVVVGEHALISPLLTVSTGGQIAQYAVSLRIPVAVPEGHFPMAFYYDETDGGLEGIPVVAFDDGSVTLLTEHFSTLVVTAADFKALNYMQIDTDFRPGLDTWQFENRGTFRNPKGICWGMSVTSLWYYLEEPWPITGERLWGTFDNGLDQAFHTPGFWPDDDFGLKVADAVSRTQDHARRDTSYDLVLQLEEEAAREPGRLLNLQLTNDQVAFYSLVTALALTEEPQLMDVFTADRKIGHSLLCYRVDGTTLYLADPNDHQSNPPLRTITLEDDHFVPYLSAPSKEDIDAGRYTEFVHVRYYGQSALSHWQEVGSIWSVGHRQPGYPEYRLLVVERDKEGNLTQEFDLDPHNPLFTTQERLELRLIPPANTTARLNLRHHETLQQPTTRPLALKPGENLVGVYVEALARWEDDQSKSTSGWRWLDYSWITVIYEPEPLPTPAVAPSASPQVAEQGPQPTVERAFGESDCWCPALTPPGASVESTSERRSLHCSYIWPQGELSAKVILRATERDDPETSLSTLQRQLGYVCQGAMACTSSDGVSHQILESDDLRFTRISSGPRAASRWLGHRGVIYRDRFYISINPSIPGPYTQAELLRLLDEAEACACAAVDRYLALGAEQ